MVWGTMVWYGGLRRGPYIGVNTGHYPIPGDSIRLRANNALSSGEESDELGAHQDEYPGYGPYGVVWGRDGDTMVMVHTPLYPCIPHVGVYHGIRW